jgi:hypothetical protein
VFVQIPQHALLSDGYDFVLFHRIHANNGSY